MQLQDFVYLCNKNNRIWQRLAVQAFVWFRN